MEYVIPSYSGYSFEIIINISTLILHARAQAVGRNYADIIRGTGFLIAFGASESEVISKARRFGVECGWPPRVMDYWLDNRRSVHGVLPENYVEALQSYIKKGITFFTCVFIDIDDMRIFSEKVIPEVQ